MSGDAITCSNCGNEWPEDPALQVECPKCGAEPGEKCRRPSGHPVNINTQLHGIHRERDQHALDVLPDYEKCEKASSHDQSSSETRQTCLDSLAQGDT